MVAKGDRLLKVSVKGSQDGSWGLCQGHLKNAEYGSAINLWLQRFKPRTVICFVQFREVDIEQMPRSYLAIPQEVAQRLRETANRRGDTILYERHTWGPRAHAAGSIEEIPPHWAFSPERIEQLFQVA